MRKIATAIAALLTLTACAPETQTYDTPQQIITDVRSSGVDCEIDEWWEEASPDHVSSCVTDDVDSVVARVFDTAGEYDEYRADMTGPVIFGDLWAVECTDSADCGHVHGVTGGDLVS